jgi:hypothetical protein
MKISKGLTQAYQSQDVAFDGLISLKAGLTVEAGKLFVVRAAAIVPIVKAWQACQDGSPSPDAFNRQLGSKLYPETAQHICPRSIQTTANVIARFHRAARISLMCYG